MVENQPYTPETTNQAESGVDSRQENLSKEADDLKKLIDSKNTEEINSKLNDNFLNNLENGLHPDTAIQLKTAIEQVDGYNTEGTNFNKLYKYVVSICDAFDKDEQDNNDHESITENYNIELNDNVKRIMNGFIAKNDMMNIVFQDEKLSSQLSAIKGILNGEQVSGSVIVNMAEFLGIKIKSDDRYGRNRIRKLGNKIFSTDNPNSLFKWLENKYEQVSKSEKITAFRANPFDSGHSLNDVYNFLKIGNRNGGDIDKDNQQVKQFCEALGIDSTKFAEDFSKKNTERKNTNETKLEEFDITTMLGDKKIIKKSEDDTKIYLAGGEGGEDTELTKDNFIEILSISADEIARSLEGTCFVGNELSVAIDGKKDTWFNAIAGKAVVQETEPEEPETPALSEFTESDFDSNLKLFNVTKENIVTAISAAKERLDAEGVSEEDKATFTERINEVIAALKDGGDRTHGTGSEKILELQNTMNEALDSLKSRPLIADGKLGRNTFFAIKEFLGIATRGDRVKYDVPIRKVSDGMAEDYEGFDDLSDENKDSVEAQLRDPRERLKHLVDSDDFPGKDKIEGINKGNSEALKAVQLQLVPYYNPKGKIQIDGKLGARTLSALENYIRDNRNKTGEKFIQHKNTFGYEESGKLKCILSGGKAYFDDFNEGNGLTYGQDGGKVTATITVNDEPTVYKYEDNQLLKWTGTEWYNANNDSIEQHLKMISEARDIGTNTAEIISGYNT